MKHYTNNPRKISKKELRQLRTDLEELGDLGGFVHNLTTDEIVGGNQRSEAIPGILAGKLQPVITQRYDPPNAQGTVAVGFIEWQGEQFKYRAVRWDEATARRANIRANKAGGDWDWDALSSWDASELIQWGFDGETLKDWGNNVSALGALLGSEEEGEPDEQYSRKIEAPIYTPKGDKPAIKDLYDNTRTAELLAAINASELPEDEKNFLRIAAQRHTVLNFKRIAEYYAHSEKEVQLLMEDSALVIIDFRRAIELGYVKLSEEIAAQYLKDYPDAG